MKWVAALSRLFLVRGVRTVASSPWLPPGFISSDVCQPQKTAKHHLLTLSIVLLSVHFLFANLGYFFIFKTCSLTHVNLAVVGPVAALGRFLAAWRGGPPPGWRPRSLQAFPVWPTGLVTPSTRGLPGRGIELVSAARWILNHSTPRGAHVH